MPEISIIVPVYKVEKYLNRCIDSILNQTITDFECILVDDGSPDRCGAICDEYAQKDNRVKVIHKKNGGLSDARNAGLNIANGNYIGFVDSDDWIHPQMYEILYDIIQKTKSEFATCKICYVEEYNPNFKNFNIDNIIKQTQTYYKEDILNEFHEKFFNDIWPSVCCKLYNRSVFNKIRFETGKIYEDAIIMMDTIDTAKSISVINVPLYYYFCMSNSITRSTFNINRYDILYSQQKRLNYFISLGIDHQANYYKREYLLGTLMMYYRVKKKSPELLKDFNPYMKFYKLNLFKYIKNNNFVCNMDKVIFVLFALHPIFAEKLYNKYLA